MISDACAGPSAKPARRNSFCGSSIHRQPDFNAASHLALSFLQHRFVKLDALGKVSQLISFSTNGGRAPAAWPA